MELKAEQADEATGNSGQPCEAECAKRIGKPGITPARPAKPGGEQGGGQQLRCDADPARIYRQA